MKAFGERLLLWRPRYAELQPVGPSVAKSTLVAKGELRAVINDLLHHRASAQESLTQTRPELRRVQTDPFSPLGLVLPRYPFRHKRERDLAEQYQPAAATLLATALVTNCPPELAIEAGVLEDRLGVGTIVGEYREFGTRATRLVVLETPGTQTLKGALDAGRALTRLCELSRSCREFLQATVGSRVGPDSQGF